MTSCSQCAGHVAWADQLQNEVMHLQAQEKYLLEQVKDRERKLESVVRELREAKEELRMRRELTGYVPSLDTPLDE